MQTKPYNIELLHNVDKEFEEEFYKYSKSVEYTKGSSPFSTDDLLKYFYIVLDGKIKTYQINFANSREQTFYIYKRGDMFDVVSLLDEKPHEVIYEVLENSKLLQLPIERVKYWLDNSATFKSVFFPYIASKIRYVEELASELSLYDVQERLVHLIVESINPNNNLKYNILENLSNSEVSKLLGTVRHVVERSLKDLKEQNVLERSRKNIKVLNFEKLLEKTDKMLHK